MPTEDRRELADLLQHSTMSNITKTIKLIKDRLSAIEYLKKLVFDESRFTSEIGHLQPFIEDHYWLFGEQYYLVTAEEPDFEEALRRYLYVLHGEKLPKGSVLIDDQQKKRQMDIFAVQQTKDNQVKKCIVVELKRPSKTLTSKELQQVKDYFNVILNEDRFNAPNIEWEFYLVGNTYNQEIEGEIESNANHGERSLAYKVKNRKIYIKKWSEIFTEHEINYAFIEEKLKLQQENLIKNNNITPDEIVDLQKYNSAKRPAEIKA